MPPPRASRAQLPDSLESLGGAQFRKIDFSPLLTKETIIVLYPPSLRTVAVEIESKFTEAALGHVQTADYRQFAHGRHHWLATRGDDTAVLALSAGTEDAVATRTLRLLPDAIPTVRLDLPNGGPVACLAGVAHGFELVRQAGEVRRIDPGDPGVPEFGRRLYNLGVFPRVRPSGLIADAEVAISRKSRSPGVRHSATIWEDAYKRFLATLGSARIRAVVLDYDGTLCDEAKRFDPLPTAVAEELIRILRAGIPVGVATGRGKSVRERLQEALPSELWRQVVVGYYNGGDIGPLTDDERPDGTKLVSEPLRPVEELLDRHRPFLGPCETELRPRQITLKPADSIPLDRLWQCVQGLVSHLAGVTVLRSGHSIDILAPGVSKLAVVRRVGGHCRLFDRRGSVHRRPGVLAGQRSRTSRHPALPQRERDLRRPGPLLESCSGWVARIAGDSGLPVAAEEVTRLVTVRPSRRSEESNVNQEFVLGKLSDLHGMGRRAGPQRVRVAAADVPDEVRRLSGVSGGDAVHREPDGLAPAVLDRNTVRAAYQFVRENLVFISPAEMRHLVELFYPETVQPRLIRRVAEVRQDPTVPGVGDPGAVGDSTRRC